MIYDALINSYTRQVAALEQRLSDLRADKSHPRDDIYSSRVALLENEIFDLRIAVKHLQVRQDGGS